MLFPRFKSDCFEILHYTKGVLLRYIIKKITSADSTVRLYLPTVFKNSILSKKSQILKPTERLKIGKHIWDEMDR